MKIPATLYGLLLFLVNCAALIVPSRIAIAQESAAGITLEQAQSLMRNGDMAGAVAAFTSLTAKTPEDGRAWYGLASALHRLGRYDEKEQSKK